MQNRTIVVTGAGGVLGATVARAAGERGAVVAMLDVTAIPADRGAQGAGHLRLGGVDLTDFTAVQGAMDEIKAKTGRLDALINIAGGFRWQTLADGDLDAWDALYRINLKTAATACKAALPHLIASGAGRIVNVGALAAVKAGAGMGAYAASKAGVLKLTESLAEELKGRVTVNAVLPSIIDTPANRADMPDADVSKWVAPRDLAAVILFLASDEARAVTGALLPVTGGV
jgi:NAD(P)-dependent dehydrogenase (short-subunit alcohol dehydrogenase family)